MGTKPLREAQRTSENAFVRKYGGAYLERKKSLDGGESSSKEALEQELREFHRAVSLATHKAKHLFFSLYNLSAGEMPQKAGLLEDLPRFFDETTSYSELFDCVTMTDGGLDLFSPTAYFADLLRIIETYITTEFDIPNGHRLRDRRPDLYTRLLTKENAETLLPYTDIILERLIALLQEIAPDVFGNGATGGAKADDSKIQAYCANNVYPVSLPFSLPYHTVAAAVTNHFCPARLLLVFGMASLAAPSAKLTAATFGIDTGYLARLQACGDDFYPDLHDWKDFSTMDVDLVLRATGLSLLDLDALLGRGMATAEEFKLAAPNFYINQGLAVCLELSEDAKYVKGLTAESVANLVRFARYTALTGLAYDQLDAVISGGDGDSAIFLLAAIRNMPKSPDALLPLVSSLYDYGPTNTFQAVYGDGLSLNETYHFPVILATLAASLGVSENEAAQLYAHLFGSATAVSTAQFNALYRNAYMAGLLGLEIDGYLTLAGLAGIPPAALCEAFAAETISTLLSYGDLRSMNAYEANYICTGAETPYANDGMKEEDFTRFLADIKMQVSPLSGEAEEKKEIIVEQSLIGFLGIKQELSETLFSLIPPAPPDFCSWQETFCRDDGAKFAYHAAKRLARAKLLLDKTPSDVFSLFASELFTDDFDQTIPYTELVALCEVSQYYIANPIFFMLVADALEKKDGAALASLCALSETDLASLLDPLALSLLGIRQFASRLDALKSVGLPVANLLEYLGALTKEDSYDDLLAIAANLPVPNGSNRAYCSALTALAAQKFGETHPDLGTPDEISAYLLLDVQTDESVQVSYIREGINAALNYLNRCRSGLEPGVGRIDGISDEYWSWIMSFSEWKANRMVFVMPENYLLPDIRSSQSAIFQKALQGVAGKPLDAAAAETLYSEYLDDYATISSIVPCASYLSSDKESEQLYLFGRTHLGNAPTSGSGFYYCLRQDGIWGEWTSISAPIPVTEITPIFIFGKLYIFWMEQSAGITPEISYTPKTANAPTAETAPVLLQNTSNITKFSIKYTYRNLSGTWSTTQTLFDDECVLENTEVDYGKQFQNAYDANGEGYKRLTAFRITERNFCDASGKYYIRQNSEFEKLLIVFGSFLYNFPNETIEDYFPLDSPFDTKDKASFSQKHADLCEKINILSQQNISGRLCSGSARIYGSSLREEHIVADGEFFLFDEYTGGSESTVTAVTTDESSSIISSLLTADVLKNTLLPVDKIIPKFVGQSLPEYSYEGEAKNYRGEFRDTLNTYILGTSPDTTLKDFQNYLKSVNIAEFKDSGLVIINPQSLRATTFYASTSDPGILPAQFSDLYSVLLQCLGSQNLFGSVDNRLASDAEIIKTANLAGGFLLKTGGMGCETFLLTPVPPQRADGKPAQLLPTDASLVISYPKITANDIENAVGDCGKSGSDIFDKLSDDKHLLIDSDGYAYMPSVSEDNIRSALEQIFGANVPASATLGLCHLLLDRRLASSNMFWSQDLDKKTSVAVFAALTDCQAAGYAVLPVDETVAMQTNPKVKLRDTQVIGTKTPADVSSIFHRYVNAPLPVSLRFRGNKELLFDAGSIKYDVTRLTNASLPYLVPIFSSGGVSAFLALENQQAPVPTVFPIERFSPNTKALNLPLALDGAQPDFDGLYKNYNYELFYHIPIFAAKTLRDFGNYPDAKKWLEYVYSPLATERFITSETFTPVIPGKETACLTVLTGTKCLVEVEGSAAEKYRVKYGFCYEYFEQSGAGEQLKAKDFSPEDIDNVVAILSNYTLGGSYSYCWQFFPFRSRTIQDLTKDLQDSAALRNYHNNPFDPHAIASLRIGAYEKYTVLEYADLLTEWGDREFAKLTWDSIANASSLYQMANDVLGKKPAVLSQRPAKDAARCFDDLYGQTENAQTKGIEKLLETLTLSLLHESGGNNGSVVRDVADTEFFLPYFKIPVNTAVLAKWDVLADRLMKIRNNLDLNGSPRSIPLFPAAANPLQLAMSRAGGYSSASAKQPAVLDNWYRYSVLYSYAKNFCMSVMQFSAQLLSAIEKGDNEALHILATRQSAELTAFTKMTRENTIKELDEEQKALEAAKSFACARQKHYEKLVAENISKTELAAIVQNIYAGVFNATAAGLAIGGGTAALVPEVGSPFAMVYGGREVSGSLMDFSMASMSTAATLGNSAGVTAAYAEYSRRLEEWKLQVEQAKNDIEQIDAQMAATKIRRQSAVYDQASTNLLEEQTAQLMDFYQTKFSSLSLYNMLSGLLRQTVFHSYQTAIELAARAEKAWQEETDDATTFLTYTYWDDAKCGLMSGEALMAALDAMQAAYVAKNPHRLEITKMISLADACPAAFAQLQDSNICNFTLPLSLFDDEKAPACRLHKIRSLTVSTQVLLGAYQNISAKLTQTGSAILADPNKPGAVKYVATFGQGSATVPDGVVVNRRSGQSISISNAQNESGLHFYDPASSAYLPFENTGAVSQWRLEYGAQNPFNPKDVSDVILHIAYTALPST